MTLGQHLTYLRTRQGWSQDVLAEQLGVSRQSVSKWETDSSVPDLDKLLGLSALFGVTLDELVKGPAEDGPRADTESEDVPSDPGDFPVESSGSADTPDGPASLEAEAWNPAAGSAPMAQGPSAHSAGSCEAAFQGAAESQGRKADERGPAAQAGDPARSLTVRIAGVILLCGGFLLSLVFFQLLPLLVLPMALGAVCLLSRRRLGLALGWTAMLYALVCTRLFTAISPGSLLSPGYYRSASPILLLLGWALIISLGLLVWRTVRWPPSLPVCWALWAGIVFTLGLGYFTDFRWSLALLLGSFRSPMGAVFLVTLAGTLALLLRRTWRAAGESDNDL